MLSSYLVPLRAIQEFRPAKYLVESHSHPFFHLIFVTSGSALVFCNDVWSELKAGDLISISPYQTHMIYTTNGVASMDLKFSCTDNLSGLKNALTNRSFWLWRNATSVSTLLSSIMDEARADQAYNVEIISAEIYMLLMQMLRENTAAIHQPPLLPIDSPTAAEDNELLRHALNYIDAHLLDDLSVSDLAKYLGYSTSYFSTIFKKELHIPPQQYILLKKIDYAKKLIRQNQKSISVISDMLHFCSVQAFTNTFKKYCGISPKQYYKQNSTCSYINLVDTPLLPPNNSRDVELTFCQNLKYQVETNDPS